MKVPLTIVPGVPLTCHEGLQITHPRGTRPAELERLESVIHQNSYKVSPAALQFFCHHPPSKRCHARHPPRPLWVGIGCGQWPLLPEQTDGGVDGHHLVIVREVGVHCSIEGERNRRRIQGSICLCLVLNWLTSETGNQFVDVANPLHRTKLFAVPKKVEGEII